MGQKTGEEKNVKELNRQELEFIKSKIKYILCNQLFTCKNKTELNLSSQVTNEQKHQQQNNNNNINNQIKV